MISEEQLKQLSVLSEEEKLAGLAINVTHRLSRTYEGIIRYGKERKDYDGNVLIPDPQHDFTMSETPKLVKSTLYKPRAYIWGPFTYKNSLISNSTIEETIASCLQYPKEPIQLMGSIYLQEFSDFKQYH